MALQVDPAAEQDAPGDLSHGGSQPVVEVEGARGADRHEALQRREVVGLVRRFRTLPQGGLEDRRLLRLLPAAQGPDGCGQHSGSDEDEVHVRPRGGGAGREQQGDAKGQRHGGQRHEPARPRSRRHQRLSRQLGHAEILTDLLECLDRLDPHLLTHLVL